MDGAGVAGAIGGSAEGCGLGIAQSRESASIQNVRQRDIPAWEELRACVKRICLGESLEEMQRATDREYSAAHDRMRGKDARILAFINFVLRGYLVDPTKKISAFPHHLATYSGELATVQHRLRQLGVLPKKPESL